MMIWVSLVGELADDGIELIEGEALIGGGLVVDVSRVQHLQNIVIVDRIMQLPGNTLELLEINHSVLILVVEGKDTFQTVLGLGLTHAGSNGVDELIESNGLVLLPEAVDKAQDEGVSLVETQLLQHLVDLDGVDGSTVVLIEHLEGMHQLLVVLGSQTVLPGSGHGLGGLGRRGGGLGVTGYSAHNILRELIIFNRSQIRLYKQAHHGGLAYHGKGGKRYGRGAGRQREGGYCIYILILPLLSELAKSCKFFSAEPKYYFFQTSFPLNVPKAPS